MSGFVAVYVAVSGMIGRNQTGKRSSARQDEESYAFRNSERDGLCMEQNAYGKMGSGM